MSANQPPTGAPALNPIPNPSCCDGCRDTHELFHALTFIRPKETSCQRFKLFGTRGGGAGFICSLPLVVSGMTTMSPSLPEDGISMTDGCSFDNDWEDEGSSITFLSAPEDDEDADHTRYRFAAHSAQLNSSPSYDRFRPPRATSKLSSAPMDLD